MSEPEQPQPENAEGAKQPDEAGAIPLDHPAPDARSSLAADAERPSLLRLADDRCPNCMGALEPEAVVCFACGYDLRTGQVVRPKLGTVEVEPSGDEAEEDTAGKVAEFVTLGRGSAKFVAIVGGVVVLVAMATAGANTPGKAWGSSIASAILVVQQCLLHTGTGLVGLWVAAKILGEKFDRHVDLGAARMFLAFSVFTLIKTLQVSIEYPFLNAIFKLFVFVLAAGGYWLVLFALFRKTRHQVGVLAVCHLGVWLFIEVGIWLQETVHLAITAK